MIRLKWLLLMIGVLALAVAPAAANAAGSGAAVFQVRFNGEVAIGQWTTCPQLVLGAVCDDTVVIASSAATAERWPDGRLRDRKPRVVLQRYRYEVLELDGGLTGRPLQQSFGGTSDATVRIDTQARGATVQSESIPMTTMDFADDVQFAESAALDATWSATGPRTAIKGRYVASGRGWHVTAGTRGWERAAAAAGSIDGAPIPGEFGSATITHVVQSELRVYTPVLG